MKKFLAILFATFMISTQAMAISEQNYAADMANKVMPFYVKVDDKMMPRYGKNYCIIPGLHAGVVHIEILFEQNKLPAEKFDIKVPENGYRALLLDKRNDSYILYDLQKKKYLDTKEEQ